LIAELRKRVPLGGMPCAFDELHDTDALAAADIGVGEHEIRQPECQAVHSIGILPHAASAAARSRGASMVRQDAPRRPRCALIRAAISSSPASAVAT